MRSFKLILMLSIAVALPTAACRAQTICPQQVLAGQYPVLVNEKLATRTTLLCNASYTVLASGITHGPLWSAEHPTRASLEEAGQTKRDGYFHADDRLPPGDQAQLDDFRRSGFDRGHMTPSGDMPGQAAQQESFMLSNVVPQTAALNRGIWEGTEAAVRHLAEQEGELFVVTGPAFHGETLETIGPNKVFVPSSTWKAVYDPVTGGAGVYVCKNIEQHPTCAQVTVATLISVVGIDPFPSLSNTIKTARFALPEPEASRYAHEREPSRRPRPEPSWLDRLLN